MLGILRLPFALLVLMYQSLMLALAQIRANKVRSILTTIGIVIGIASVTAVIAALTGLKAKVLSEFESFGTNKIFIYPQVPRNGRFARVNWRRIRFTPDQLEGMLDHCPSVRAVTQMVDFQNTVTNGERAEENVPIHGIEPDWHVIENRYVTIGRPFTLIDNQQGRAVCLINDKLRAKLALPVDCTGRAIVLGGRRYLIVGVVETRQESSMFGENQSGSEVFVPFRTAYRSDRMYIHVLAASRSPDVAEEAQAEITFFLRHTRHVRMGESDNFQVEVIQKFIDQFKSTATTMTIIAAGIVSISLLVGGVGIMNIMLVSVSERTREIGLRKAVGARPTAILLQFLVEAVMLCCLGGLFGVLGGQGLTKIIASIPNAELGKASIPGWAIALSFGFAATVGLVFGMFPAIKAARLDPIEALRHE